VLQRLVYLMQLSVYLMQLLPLAGELGFQATNVRVEFFRTPIPLALVARGLEPFAFDSKLLTLSFETLSLRFELVALCVESLPLREAIRLHPLTLHLPLRVEPLTLGIEHGDCTLPLRVEVRRPALALAVQYGHVPLAFGFNLLVGFFPYTHRSVRGCLFGLTSELRNKLSGGLFCLGADARRHLCCGAFSLSAHARGRLLGLRAQAGGFGDESSFRFGPRCTHFGFEPSHPFSFEALRLRRPAAIRFSRRGTTGSLQDLLLLFGDQGQLRLEFLLKTRTEAVYNLTKLFLWHGFAIIVRSERLR
jgi:hypothetical protein